MLVLSRKQGESLEFAELGVVVKVISLKKSKVQIGIEAPRDITVSRSEISANHRIDDESEPNHRRAKPLGDQRILDELARVEGELAALAELADPKDRSIARQVAADSIQRLAAVRRTLRLTTDPRSGARPISDFVKVRSDVLEHLRGESPGNPDSETPVPWAASQSDRASCVHQQPSGYAILASNSANACVA